MILLLLGLSFILLTAVGMPISFAVGVSTVFATLLLPGVDNATIVQRMLTAINTFPLLAVIFFVFAGTLMARGGIARRLVLMAEVLVGWLPGSLAQIVCVASMFFGGVTGSAVAEVFGLRLSGFLAWWLWRTVYLMKLPGLDRKLRGEEFGPQDDQPNQIRLALGRKYCRSGVDRGPWHVGHAADLDQDVSARTQSIHGALRIS